MKQSPLPQQQSSLGEDGEDVLLLLGRLHDAQAAVGELQEQRLLHQPPQEGAFVPSLLQGQQQLPQVRVPQQIPQLRRFPWAGREKTELQPSYSRAWGQQTFPGTQQLSGKL